MNITRRVVFDIGTLVCAALRPNSPADRALVFAFREALVCVSNDTIQRLHTVVNRSKWDRYMTKRARLAFVDVLRRNAWHCQVTVFDGVSPLPRFRDKAVGAILSLADTAEADAIVASSPDLLARKRWRKIPIVTPSEFVSWYDPA